MSSKLNLLRLAYDEPHKQMQTFDRNPNDAKHTTGALRRFAHIGTPIDEVLDVEKPRTLIDLPDVVEAEDEPHAETDLSVYAPRLENRAIHDDAVRLAAKLRAKLDDADRILLFTGASDSDAASRVAAETAFALAHMMIGDVVLVDANPRAPVLHEDFDLPASPGYTDALAGIATPEESLHEVGANLVLMPIGASLVAGRVPHAGEAAEMLQSLSRRARFIIVGAPPLLDSADATLLAAASNGAVIVSTRSRDTLDQLARTKRELDGLRCRTLGVVLCEEPTRGFLRRDARSLAR